VKGGRDAVCDELAIGLDKRQLEVDADARPGHHLALEGITMHIDETRQHEKAGGIERGRGRCGLEAEPSPRVRSPNDHLRGLEATLDQRRATADVNCRLVSHASSPAAGGHAAPVNPPRLSQVSMERFLHCTSSRILQPPKPASK
jgi:hypothetical protein